jgi:rhamnulokinase
VDLVAFWGGSQNRMLNRLTEQATALPLVLGPSEATALGNILVQMGATGEGSRLDKLRQTSAFEMPPFDAEIKP